MSSPGKYLVDLAKHLEEDLNACGREVSCVDLAYGSSVIAPVLRNDCGSLVVDVGPDQNPFRAINLNTGQILYQPQNGCVRGWRFNGTVRVTGKFDFLPGDCCHEHTADTYYFTNTLGIVSESIFGFLESVSDDEEDSSGGEGVQTEFVSSYNGGAVTVAINFSMRVCMPSCEDLMAEEALMLGELNGYKG